MAIVNHVKPDVISAASYYLVDNPVQAPPTWTPVPGVGFTLGDMAAELTILVNVVGPSEPVEFRLVVAHEGNPPRHVLGTDGSFVEILVFSPPAAPDIRLEWRSLGGGLVGPNTVIVAQIIDTDWGGLTRRVFNERA